MSDTDVFGRPLNLHQTSYKVNRNIAPNPLGPVPQDNPFGGMAKPGDQGSVRASAGAFTAESVAGENIGAAHKITASQPQSRVVPAEPHVRGDYWGGSVLPSAHHRPEQMIDATGPAIPGM